MLKYRTNFTLYFSNLSLLNHLFTPDEQLTTVPQARSEVRSVKGRKVILFDIWRVCLSLRGLIDFQSAYPTFPPFDPLNNDFQQAKIIGVWTIGEMFV